MVERHEGPESAAIARYWLARQPDAFLTVRSVTGELIGFACHLRLAAVSPADLAADPAVAHAMAHVERHGPHGAGEHTTYGRFFMHADRYQVTGAGLRCGERVAALDCAGARVVLHCRRATGPLRTTLHRASCLADARRGLPGRRPALWRVRARLARRERRAVGSIESRARLAYRAPFPGSTPLRPPVTLDPRRIRSRSPRVPKDFLTRCLHPEGRRARHRAPAAAPGGPHGL